MLRIDASPPQHVASAALAPGGGFLYEQLAHELAASIARGALRGGERLPSVRRLSEERGCSVATVLQAYLQLENDGLVEVRPKSGHYVRARRAGALGELRVARKTPAPAKIDLSSAVATLLAAVGEPDVVPFGAAVIAPELLPTARLNRTLAAIARESSTAGASYDMPPGLPTLRRQIARRAAGRGVALRPEEVVTTVGAAEAIHLALRATTRPGDSVAVEAPTYYGVLQLIEMLGLRAVEIPSHPRSGMDLDALEEVLKVTPIRAVIAMATVGNPLGAVTSDAAKERLVRVLARHDLPLIEDDVYGELVFDGTRPRLARSFDTAGRVLVCGSVSKTLAPGYRVGWIMPGRYQQQIERLKFATSVASPTLTQMAVAEFLASGGYDRHLRRLRRVLGGQVERMREAVAFAFPPGTRVSTPRGGFMLWIDAPGVTDAFALQARALERRISIAPGPIFSARQRFHSCFRVSCGYPWSSRLEEAIGTLGELVAGRPAKRTGRGAVAP